MEKSPATLDERCGTHQKAKWHRMHGEELCQPCRDAQNAYRRQLWARKPEVYRGQSKRYKERHPERIKQHSKKYNLDPVVKEQRKQERMQATVSKHEAQKKFKEESRKAALEERRLAREAKKNDPAVLAQKRANQEKAWEEARERIRALNAIAHEKAEIRKAEERVIKEAEKARNQEERERKALLAKVAKIIRKRLRVKKERILLDQHGTNTGDYSRCKKINGKACDLCRAYSAKYVREKYKSDPKYKEAEKRWRKENPHKALRNSKDRARKKGVPSEYYTRQHIFDRDGYDCYICGTPTDLTAPHVQGQPGWELYPHIEHVIPLAKGGHDTKDNVKIAHAKCNIDKGVNLLY